jgi:hypothetical protein
MAKKEHARRRPQPHVGRLCSSYLLTVPIALRIVFSIVRHCSRAGGFSVGLARACIVIGAHIPL